MANKYQDYLDSIDDFPKTHWEGCWKSHHLCAVAEAARLAAHPSPALEEEVVEMVKRLRDHEYNRILGDKSIERLHDEAADLLERRKG